MRCLTALLFIFMLSGLALAQEVELTPYEIALQRIEELRGSEVTYLDLSGFNLDELPPEIGSLENLTELHLSGNHLSNLPPELFNLNNLWRLGLSDNPLRELPPEIGNLSNLRVLYLRNNQFSSIPSTIGNLTKLYWLDLSANQLSTLPSEIRNLNNLCYLDFSDNNLQFIPSELGQITQLATSTDCERGFYGLHLEGNPLISPPPEVIEQGTPAILGYLRNEAAWHLKKLLTGGASFAGILAATILGLRWKNRHRGKKKNEG